MTRNKRICSYYVDFCFHTLVFCMSLLKRGYDKKKLLLDFRTVNKIKRIKLILYKEKSVNKIFFTPNSISFSRVYTENLDNKDSLIYDSFNKTINTKKQSKLDIINKLDLNLGNILVNGFSRFENITKPCNNCSICDRLLGSPQLKILDLNLNLKLLDNGDCDSIQLIYIIFCCLCNLFYIVETNNSLKTRIKQHLNQIEKFIPFYKYHDKIVAKHFNLRDHMFHTCLNSFFIIKF